MKKILIFVGLAVLLVGLPLISKMRSGSDAKQVEVEQAEYTLIQSSILASGTLAFKEQVQLRSEVIGKAIEVHVMEGDKVKLGDPLITLDRRTSRISHAGYSPGRRQHNLEVSGSSQSRRAGPLYGNILNTGSAA